MKNSMKLLNIFKVYIYILICIYTNFTLVILVNLTFLNRNTNRISVKAVQTSQFDRKRFWVVTHYSLSYSLYIISEVKDRGIKYG